MSKLNLIIGIAIIATFSMLFTNVVIEAFSNLFLIIIQKKTPWEIL